MSHEGGSLRWRLASPMEDDRFAVPERGLIGWDSILGLFPVRRR
jgi:hypothetical protein